MIVKVCGIKTEDNIRSLIDSNIDMVGLNFYEPSVRYVDKSIIPEWYDMLPERVSRVGVFVNMEIDDLLDFVDEYRLDYVQLHGDENLTYTKQVKDKVPVIKVMRVGPEFDINQVSGFSFVDFILFDTDSKLYGGSGHQFDWSLLKEYPLDIPFLIGGGIGPDDADKIKNFSHPQFAGVDINSKFESEPGVKDIGKVDEFIGELNNR